MTARARQPLPPGAWQPPAHGMVVEPTFAIASDLSGVIQTNDGFGSFKTEVEALDALISRLQDQRGIISEILAASRRRRRVLVCRGNR